MSAERESGDTGRSHDILVELLATLRCGCRCGRAITADNRPAIVIADGTTTPEYVVRCQQCAAQPIVARGREMA